MCSSYSVEEFPVSSFWLEQGLYRTKNNRDGMKPHPAEA
jgi:hypothetical protein